ncbi:MAG TPA: amidohydrolase family protein [Gaiellaceae bacterium]|nr:amidohydrolase family protein [Gaiellaceae bacterium]
MLVDCDIHLGYDRPRRSRPVPRRTDARARRPLGVARPVDALVPVESPDGLDPARCVCGRRRWRWFRLRRRSLARHAARPSPRPLCIDIGIVEPDEAAAFPILPNAQLAAKLCTAYNDFLLERWLQEEPRLRGMLVVPAQYPESAAQEIRRVGGRDEFVGVFLPGAARVPYGNPVYDPMWEALDELALPVAVHMHFESVGIGGPVTAAGMPDYYVEYHTLCGSGMYGHFVSILCHGIFERFPNTRLAMVEGGLVPFVGFLWRLDTNWKSCRNEIPWCRRPPSEYVWEHVRFATQPLETPDDPELLVRAIEGLRPWDTLMFASDFPHWDFDEPEQTLGLLPAEWREAVRSQNACDFFRLPAPVRA